MKVKTYQASSMKEALEQVKKELGHDAFILSGKEVKGKKMMGFFGKSHFEVTAAVDYAAPAGKPTSSSRAPQPEPQMDRAGVDDVHDIFRFSTQGPRQNAAALKPAAAKSAAPAKGLAETAEGPANGALLQEIRNLREMIQSMPRPAAQARPAAVHRTMPVRRSTRFPHPVYEEVALALRARELDESLASELIEQVIKECRTASVPNKKQVERKIAAFLLRRIHLSDELLAVPKAGKQRVLAMIGPTGVGKTTTLAKLAARAILNQRLKVGFITIDTFRIAAAEQLKTYAEIIDVPTKVVENVKGVAGAIAEFADRDLVLVDTAGRSPRERNSLQELASAFNELPNLHKALLLSATTKRSDLTEIAESYKVFHPGCVIFTKLDETQVYGTVLSHLVRAASPLACFTVGQNVPKDLVVPDAAYIDALFQGQAGRFLEEAKAPENRLKASNLPRKKIAAKRAAALTKSEVTLNV
jgi:flagellar biosynthesis protein FlhF